MRIWGLWPWSTTSSQMNCFFSFHRSWYPIDCSYCSSPLIGSESMVVGSSMKRCDDWSLIARFRSANKTCFSASVGNLSFLLFIDLSAFDFLAPFWISRNEIQFRQTIPRCIFSNPIWCALHHASHYCFEKMKRNQSNGWIRTSGTRTGQSEWRTSIRISLRKQPQQQYLGASLSLEHDTEIKCVKVSWSRKCFAFVVRQSPPQKHDDSFDSFHLFIWWKHARTCTHGPSQPM